MSNSRGAQRLASQERVASKSSGPPSRCSVVEGLFRRRYLELIDVELPGVAEDGMSGKNGQQKPGTARGSPRRSRTAKASHISRHAVKLRCACERGGWGR